MKNSINYILYGIITCWTSSSAQNEEITPFALVKSHLTATGILQSWASIKSIKVTVNYSDKENSYPHTDIYYITFPITYDKTTFYTERHTFSNETERKSTAWIRASNVESWWQGYNSRPVEMYPSSVRQLGLEFIKELLPFFDVVPLLLSPEKQNEYEDFINQNFKVSRELMEGTECVFLKSNDNSESYIFSPESFLLLRDSKGNKFGKNSLVGDKLFIPNFISNEYNLTEITEFIVDPMIPINLFNPPKGKAKQIITLEQQIKRLSFLEILKKVGNFTQIALTTASPYIENWKKEEPLVTQYKEQMKEIDRMSQESKMKEELSKTEDIARTASGSSTTLTASKTYSQWAYKPVATVAHGFSSQPVDLVVKNNHLFVISGSASGKSQLAIIDINNLASPRIVKRINYDGLNFESIVESNDVLYVAGGGKFGNLTIVSIADPTNVYTLRSYRSIADTKGVTHIVGTERVNKIGQYVIVQENDFAGLLFVDVSSVNSISAGNPIVVSSTAAFVEKGGAHLGAFQINTNQIATVDDFRSYIFQNVNGQLKKISDLPISKDVNDADFNGRVLVTASSLKNNVAKSKLNIIEPLGSINKYIDLSKYPMWINNISVRGNLIAMSLAFSGQFYVGEFASDYTSMKHVLEDENPRSVSSINLLYNGDLLVVGDDKSITLYRKKQ